MRVRFQVPPMTTQGFPAVREKEASPLGVAIKVACAPTPVRACRITFGQGATGIAVLAVAAGCASLEPQIARAWKVEPVMNVNHVVQSSEGYYQLGRYYDGMRAWDQSIAAYRKAIAADQRNVEAYNGLGVALAQRGRHDEAERVLRGAIALDPNRSHLHSNLGYVLMLANRPHDAVRALRVAVRLDRNDATALANLREAAWRNELAQNQSDEEARELLAMVPAVAPPAAVPRPAAPAAAATVNVAAPITSVELPMPASGPVTMAAPLGATLPTSSAAAQVPAAHAIGAATPVAPVAPPAASPRPTTTVTVRVVDQPTAAPLQGASQNAAALAGETTGAAQRTQPVSPRAGELLSVVPQTGGLLVLHPTLVMRPDSSADVAAVGNAPGRRDSQLELSNGNGVLGMAARLRNWLGEQGVATNRLTNQRPFTQPYTVVHYRAGHEQSALRVARALPAPAQAIETRDINPRADVRVVLGRDWVQSAACLNAGAGCRTQGPDVARTEAPNSRTKVVPVNYRTGH